LVVSWLGSTRERLRLVGFPRRAESVRFFAVIVGLLGDANRLGLFLAHAHSHATRRRRDAELAIAELADEIEGLDGRLLASEP